MIPEEYQDLPDHLKLLFEWGSPIKPGYSYREWEDYLHLGFTDADIPNLLMLVSDFYLLEAPQDGAERWVPLYAWRILGQLKSVEAIDSLIEVAFDYPEDDTVISEIPVVLGMIGKPAMASVARMLSDKDEEEEEKITAANALAEIAQQHPELREEVISYFRQYLQAPNPDYHGHNGLLVDHLISIKAVELIDDIRSLYEKGYADISIAGDIEDVEIELGVREKRSTPRPLYHDASAIAALQKLMNIGESNIPANPGFNTPPPETFVREAPKTGRNDPCPCGSGKKYKRCCMNQ